MTNSKKKYEIRQINTSSYIQYKYESFKVTDSKADSIDERYKKSWKFYTFFQTIKDQKKFE